MVAKAHWIRLRVLSSGPGFESRAQHIRFFNLCLNCYVKRTKIKRGRVWAYLKKNQIDGLTNWQRANPLSSTVGTFLSLKVFSEYTTYQIEACLMMPMLTYLSEYSGYPGNVCL